MSFNIGQALIHGAESFLTSGGNPIAAGIGAIEGGTEQSPPQVSPQLGGIDPSQISTILGDQPDLLKELTQLSQLAKSGFAGIGGL